MRVIGLMSGTSADGIDVVLTVPGSSGGAPEVLAFETNVTKTVDPLAGSYYVENLTNEDWSSSEFYYESRPIQSGPSDEDFHFSPGNPINARAWISASF